MNRILKLSVAFLCLFCFLISATASAAGERIATSNVKVKNGRLFEVKIGVKSSRIITAARFSLTYNKNDVEVRKPVCNLSRAQVRYIDKNGSTDIIFLCSSGVKCSDFSTLFSMKYKKISDNNTTVKIKARDCVDNKLKNFTPPASAVCKVYSDGKFGSNGKSAQDYGGSGSDDTADFDENGDDILVTSDNASLSDGDNSDDVFFSGDDSPIILKIIPVILLLVVLAFLGLILYQNIQLKKSEKRREEERSNNDND